MAEIRQPSSNIAAESQPPDAQIEQAESFWELAEKIRKLTEGGPQTPSKQLLRESRDER